MAFKSEKQRSFMMKMRPDAAEGVIARDGTKVEPKERPRGKKKGGASSGAEVLMAASDRAGKGK